MSYERALRHAWNHLLAWVKEGKFKPENEEDIQSFLYHGLVTKLETAIDIRPKPTTVIPNTAVAQRAKSQKDSHFPDLLLGKKGTPDVVVEIKFARNGFVPYNKCKEDIKKMSSKHGNAQRYFILFDNSPRHVFMDQYQLDELKELAAMGCEPGRECKILYYPKILNPSPVKGWGRKAHDTMRKEREKRSQAAKKAHETMRKQRAEATS